MPEFKPECTLVAESSQYTQTRIHIISYRPSQALVLQVGTAEVGDIELRFEPTIGFRVLDELQLCEFWSDYHMKNGWLWQVNEGGWIELEQMRDSFLAAELSESAAQKMEQKVAEQNRLREYLVVSLTSCVSVMTVGPPTIRCIEE